MAPRALTNVVGVIGALVFLDLLLHAYLFYLARSGYRVTIPVALGVQVTLASLLFVVVSLSLAFFGFARLADIENQAKAEAREASRAAVHDLVREETAKLMSLPDKAPISEGGPTLEGEEEREIP